VIGCLRDLPHAGMTMVAVVFAADHFAINRSGSEMSSLEFPTVREEFAANVREPT
jgi:hypothetical protein